MSIIPGKPVWKGAVRSGFAGGANCRPAGGRGLAAASADELTGEDDDEEGEEEVSKYALEHHRVLPAADGRKARGRAACKGEGAEV